MEEEGEAALEPAGDVRSRALPRAPLRERADARQIVAIRQLLDQQVGERRGRLADGEARMTAAFDQRDAAAPLAKRERRQRAGESRADDGDVGVDVVHDAWLVARTFAAGAAVRARYGRQDALFEVHGVQAAPARVEAVRTVGEAFEIPEVDEDSAAGGRRPLACRCAASTLRSMSSRRGAGTRRRPPAPPSRRCPPASAPVTPRSAPQSKRSVDRPKQPGVLLVGRHERRRDRAGRRAAPRRVDAARRPRRRSRRRVIRLCSRSSASGCAVSRPIATSSLRGSHVELSLRSSASRNRSTRGPDERRMRLDDDPRRGPASVGGDGVVVLLRDGARIEEAAGVVQLHLRDGVDAAAPQFVARGGHLRRNGAGGVSSTCRVAPQVAHHAAPRTLAAGEKHRGHARHGPVGGPLVLDDQVLIPPGDRGEGRGARKSTTNRSRASLAPGRRGRRRSSAFIRLAARRRWPYTNSVCTQRTQTRARGTTR